MRLRLLIPFLFLLMLSAACMRTPFTQTVAESDKILMELARKSYQAGDNLSALHYCHEFLSHTSELEGNQQLDSLRNVCYRLLGNVHFMYHDYGRSLRYYDESLKISRAANDKEGAARIISNMALAACYMHDSVQGERYVKLADKNPVADRKFESFLSHIRHAIYERNFGDWRKSVSIMKIAYEEARGNKDIDPRHQLTPLSEIFQAYEEKGMLDSALIYLEQYRKLATDWNVTTMEVDAERGYIRIFQNIPDKAGQLSHHINRYFELRDSAFDTDAFLKISDQYQSELDRKGRTKIQTLQFQVSRLQIMIWALAIVILLGVIIYLWSRNSYRLRKAYGVVYESNREIVQSARRELAEAPREPAAQEPEEATESADSDPESETDDATEESSEKQRRAPEASTEELGKRIEEVMETSDKWLDPDFSISSLAALVGVNAKYVSACINDRYGKNFRTFINEYRIRTALRRMSDTETYGQYTIGAIAESVGFRSSTNFIAAFKKFTGVTPSHYLRLAKE